MGGSRSIDAARVLLKGSGPELAAGRAYYARGAAPRPVSREKSGSSGSVSEPFCVVAVPHLGDLGAGPSLPFGRREAVRMVSRTSALDEGASARPRIGSGSDGPSEPRTTTPVS